MITLAKGRYTARLAETPQEIAAALSLRGRCFRGGGDDRDRFDDICFHVIVRCDSSGDTVCAFRLLQLVGGCEIGASYSAQFYALHALECFDGAMVEVGRFCIAPDLEDTSDVLRVAWGALTTFVDRTGIELLFGCSSFAGTARDPYLDVFALLKERHLAPKRWLPQAKAPAVFQFARQLRRRRPDVKRALRGMPPLLRTYLLMGGWVSDHAVVDRDLDTLHVFTALEVRAIPPARARLLRALAG